MVFIGIVIFIFVAIIIAVIVIFSLKQRKKKYVDFVINNSVCLKDLLNTNSKFTFCSFNKHLDLYHKYDCETYYNKISCEDYLIYQLQFIKKDVLEGIKIANQNTILYKSYVAELKKITPLGRFINKPKNLNLEYLLNIEQKLLSLNKLNPFRCFTIEVRLVLKNFFDEKNQTFSKDKILELIKRLNKKNKNFYLDNEIWEAIVRVERGKVSNKLRFSIYERDHYRCCICGTKGSKGNDLEIDHIIPISKGGKTTYNNLQTLCKRCNKEKGNKIYYN